MLPRLLLKIRPRLLSHGKLNGRRGLLSKRLPSMMRQRILQARQYQQHTQYSRFHTNNPNITPSRARVGRQTSINGISSILTGRPATTATTATTAKTPKNTNTNTNNSNVLQKISSRVHSSSVSSGSLPSNGGVAASSKFGVLFSPELVGVDQEAQRLDNEHLAAQIPFNLAFDAAFEQVPQLRERSEINILEIGFGSGACVQGIFDYFNENKAVDDPNRNGNERKVVVRGIDKEDRWFDYCNSKFSEDIANQKLMLYKIDATNINDLLDVRYDKFDIILFRFFLSHVMNFESIFKYMVRYLLSNKLGSCVIIQDGILPSAAGTILMPHMMSVPNPMQQPQGKYAFTRNRRNSAMSNIINNRYKKDEFVYLQQFANEIAAPALSNVMRFDVPYVLPGLIKECGMKTVWQNEMTQGGLNGTFGFEMAVENLISNVTRFRLLGMISDREAQNIIQEIEYAKTLPESRAYTLLPLITSVVTHA